MDNPFKDDKQIATIPYHAFEKQGDKYMTIIKWLIIVIVILIISFVGYVIYNSQVETVSYTQEGEASFNSHVNIDGSGEMNAYASESETDRNRQAQETESTEGNAN